MGIPGHLWVMLGEWQIIALSDFCRWVCDLHSEVQPDSEREPGLDPDFLEKDQQPPCSKEILIVHLPLHVVINIFSTGLLPRKVLSINLASSTALLRNVSHTLSHVIQRIQIPFFSSDPLPSWQHCGHFDIVTALKIPRHRDDDTFLLFVQVSLIPKNFTALVLSEAMSCLCIFRKGEQTRLMPRAAESVKAKISPKSHFS